MISNPTDRTRGATFSACRAFRYDLWRVWSDGPSVAFIGLNPSTADETQDDPTIRRCIGFAKSWGFGRMHMLNLYAYRSTDPMGLLPDLGGKIGPANDETILDVASGCRFVVPAWGAFPFARARGEQVVLRLIAHSAAQVWVLGQNKDGSPKHPLYMRADTQPQLWGAL
jgi:hypothetical protein